MKVRSLEKEREREAKGGRLDTSIMPVRRKGGEEVREQRWRLVSRRGGAAPWQQQSYAKGCRLRIS